VLCAVMIDVRFPYATITEASHTGVPLEADGDRHINDYSISKYLSPLIFTSNFDYLSY
jgi:hypothetical protein